MAAHQAPPIPGILQARTLEWVAISFSNAWKWKVKVKSLSHIRLLATPWTAAYQAPPSMGFTRQEYWSGVPLPSPHTHTSVQQRLDWNDFKGPFVCTCLGVPRTAFWCGKRWHFGKSQWRDFFTVEIFQQGKHMEDVISGACQEYELLLLFK